MYFHIIGGVFASAKSAEKIRYALIITIEAPKHLELYSDILKSYVNTLVPMQPQIAIPIRIK